MQQIISLISDELERVESELTHTLSSQVPLINEASGYIIRSGGKRFRPMMLLLVAKYCQYQGKHLIPLACIFEYIHTATLLHDDVLDHAQMRRGNSSVNSLWGNHTSVLVGDFLLSKAFSLLVEVGDMRIMEIIADATTKVVEGESMQNEKRSDISLTEDEYTAIITNKTASLIAAACQVGAILGNTSPSREQLFREYGLNLGIAFQMVDDTLDYISNDNKFGKAVFKDLQEGKVTLPLIYTFKKASTQDKKKISAIVENGCLDDHQVSIIAHLIQKYGGTDYVLIKAQDYVNASLLALQGLDPSPIRDALVSTADYVLDRKW